MRADRFDGVRRAARLPALAAVGQAVVVGLLAVNDLEKPAGYVCPGAVPVGAG